MALADSVPGVSGGTVAFLMGFYDDFIGSLNDLMMGKMDAKKKAVLYLIKIGIGWMIGFGLSVLVLSALFEKHIYQISSLFIGFILFAIPIVIYEERKCLKEKLWTMFTLPIGTALVAGLTLFTSGGGNSVSIDNPSIGTYLYVFFAGAIAICAMVLPGISGSTLLLIFGLYINIIAAVKELMHLNFEYFPVLFVFGLGVIVGIVSIVRAVRVALDKFRSATVYFIIGMMLGSIYSVIMGPTTLDEPVDPLGFGNFSILFFLIGGVVIIGMQLMGAKKSSKALKTEDAASE
ncbi:MAG: DUF368 domain-containing protein [Oscillospiraceae bacterium]|nr:DUF368 domain-containing protein [Oscillospiraceae bacterium]